MVTWIPDGEKKFEDIFIRFDTTTHERDRHTDRQTPHDGIGRAYSSHRAAEKLRSGCTKIRQLAKYHVN